MKGGNAVAKVRPADEGLLVHSIFHTIQGEGPWAGLPTIFVRLAGCNLRCSFCDTEFEKGSVVWRASDLAKRLHYLAQEYRCSAFVITGGEPLLQNALPALIDDIQCAYFEFQIETAGTVWPEDWEETYDPERITIVCSPKTPKINETLAKFVDAWKYIIRASDNVSILDGLPIGLYRPPLNDRDHAARTFGACEIFVQPCDEGDSEAERLRSKQNLDMAVQSAMTFGYRLSIQLHKIAGLA